MPTTEFTFEWLRKLARKRFRLLPCLSLIFNQYNNTFAH